MLRILLGADLLSCVPSGSLSVEKDTQPLGELFSCSTTFFEYLRFFHCLACKVEGLGDPNPQPRSTKLPMKGIS